MRVVGLMSCLVVAGCGRLGFSEIREDAAVAMPADARADAPPGTTLVSFGETGTTTHGNVTWDAWLHGASIGHNFGGSRSVSVMQTPAVHVGLMRFDLSVLPPGTLVEVASLHVSSELIPTVGAIELYEVLEPWREGNKDGSTDTCNWTERLAGTAWTNAGAGTPQSRSTFPFAEFVPTAAGALEIQFGPSGLDIVQRWIDEPARNMGFALIAAGGANEWSFASREALTAMNRPILELAVR